MQQQQDFRAFFVTLPTGEEIGQERDAFPGV